MDPPAMGRFSSKYFRSPTIFDVCDPLGLEILRSEISSQGVCCLITRVIRYPSDRECKPRVHSDFTIKWSFNCPGRSGIRLFITRKLLTRQLRPVTSRVTTVTPSRSPTQPTKAHGGLYSPRRFVSHDRKRCAPAMAPKEV